MRQTERDRQGEREEVMVRPSEGYLSISCLSDHFQSTPQRKVAVVGSVNSW